MPALHKPPLAGLLLLAFALLCAFSMQNKSLTYDEPQHYRYGAQILLQHNSDRFDDSKMPMSVLNAIPRAIAVWTQQLTGSEQANPRLFDVRTGRYATILIALLLGVVVYRWSRELFGHRAGLLSLFLYALSPNIIAHARLITTDLYVAAWMTIALYCFWKFLKAGAPRAGWLSALTLALALIAKYSAVFLLPIFLLILLACYSPAIYRGTRQRNWQELRRAGLRFLRWSLAYLGMIILVLNMAYLFNRSFTPLAEYQFNSSFFQTLQSRLGPLAAIPVPIPYPYLEGLDQVSYVDAHLQNPIFLLGETRAASDPFKSYFLVAWLYKEPIAAQLLTIAALLLMMFRIRHSQQRTDLYFLLIPIAFLLFYYSFLFHTQIGIRYILAVFPLVYIVCGSLLQHAPKPWQTALLSVLLVWQAISVLSWFPHFLPYFNEFVGNRTQSFKILADSNISFGQDEYFLASYRQENPDAVIQPWQPVAGRIVADVNFLDRIFTSPDLRWLTENFEPVDHVAYSRLVYEISEADYQRILEQRPDYFPDADRLDTRDSYYGLSYWTARNLMILGQYQEAKIHYQKLQDYLPNDPMALEGLIEASKGLGEIEAQQTYKRELQQLQDLESLYQRAVTAINERQYSTAQTLLNDVIADQPDYKMSLYFQGVALQEQENPAAAIPYYQQYQTLYPTDFQNLYKLALALIQTGNCEQAEVLLKRCLQLRPDDTEVQQQIAGCS